MHDNLRLQRLVLQLAESVNSAVIASEDHEPSPIVESSSAESALEHHESIMGTAEAVFKEMSQQVIPHNWMQLNVCCMFQLHAKFPILHHVNSVMA